MTFESWEPVKQLACAGPGKRGLNLFSALRVYPYEERRRARGVAHAVAELPVDYSVPSFNDLVDLVERRRGDRNLEVVVSAPEDDLSFSSDVNRP